mgnify:CR=1 FL=1
MISTYLLIAGYFIFPIIIILLFNKHKWAQKIGTVILAYAIGIIIALLNTAFNFLPNGEDATTLNKIQSSLMSVCVPLAIPLMLFNSDFKLWTKSLKKTPNLPENGVSRSGCDARWRGRSIRILRLTGRKSRRGS